MAPTIRQVRGTSGSGTISLSTTSQTDVDDLLIVIHQTAWRDESDLVEPESTAGISSWTSFEVEVDGNDADIYMKCWRARVTSAGSKFIEIDPPGSNDTNSMIVLVLSDVDHDDPIVASTSADGSDASTFPISSITTDADTLLVASWGAYGSGIGDAGFDAPASMTLQRQQSHSSNNAHMCATQALTAAGATGSRTATSEETALGWAAVMFAVRGGVQTISPSSIPTAVAFGTPTVTQPSTQEIEPTSIPTAESVPSNLFVGDGSPQTITFDIGIHSGEAFGEPTLDITIDPLRRDRPARRPSTSYELVCMARVPQASGPPLLYIVEGITWSELTYVDEVSEPQSLEAHCLIDNLSESVVQRFNTLAQYATELWLSRDGKVIFAGPLVGWRVSGDDGVVLQARGLLFYLRYMAITSDLSWENEDQFTIVKDLVDHWQDQSYGDFGIDTSEVGTSGTDRTVAYKRDELHNIAARVSELAEGSFDVEVNPATRALTLRAPRKGIDRSTGPDAIVFDDRNVTDSNMLSSCAPGDIASDAFGVGTTSGEDDKVYVTEANEELRATFGRTAYTANFDENTESAAISGKLEDALQVRDSALLVPGPNVRNVADADLADYAEGDTVSYQLHERLGVRGAFRIRRRRVQVNNSGQELISLEFE